MPCQSGTGSLAIAFSRPQHPLIQLGGNDILVLCHRLASENAQDAQNLHMSTVAFPAASGEGICLTVDGQELCE